MTPRPIPWRLALAAAAAGAACAGSIEGSGDSAEVNAAGGNGASVSGAAPGATAGVASAAGGSPTSGLPPRPTNPAACALPPARLWRLTPDQYANTIQAIFGAPRQLGLRLTRTALRPQTGFSNVASALDMSTPHVEQLHANAVELALTIGAAYPCKAGADAACTRAAIADLLRKAFRRPPTADEQSRYESLYNGLGAGREPAVAFQHLARAVFLSPHFLYRTEIGSDSVAAKVTLTPYERASALSYLITNGPPDAQLFAAAERNQLGTPAELGAQARRLLEAPGTAAGLFGFFREQLDADDVASLTKDQKLFPFFTPSLAQDLDAETRLFIEQALWRESGKLPALFTADWSILSKRLFAVYGLEATGKDESFRKVTLPAGQRSGLLTQGSLLARLASSTEPSPVQRGKFVRTAFLCQDPPPPPPNVNAVPPPPSKTLTMRERLARHGADPTCSSCHRLLDPIGLGFEVFDAAGRYRTLDAGKPIDASGVVYDLDGGEARFANVVELGRALGASRSVRACLATRLYEYALGRAAGEADACAVDDLTARFEQSGGDVRALLADIVTSDAFALRTRPPN